MKIWIVNTNTKEENENPNGYKYMLRQNKASAFWDKRHKVDPIKPEDLVLLYHNKNRIIAVGCAIESHNNPDYVKDVEHWIDVNWIWKASFNSDNKPINFIDRYNIGLGKLVMNNTVINVTSSIDYEKLLMEIAKNQIFNL